MMADKIKDEMMEKVQGGIDADTNKKKDSADDKATINDDGEMKGVAKRKTGNLLRQ